MIVVRDVFRLHFGKAREAIAVFKEIGEHAQKAGYNPANLRVLTDLVGPYYTLVMETTVESLTTWEEMGRKAMGDNEWRARYQKFTPLVESGYREIFTVVQ